MNSSAEQVSSVLDDDLNRQAHFDLSMRARGGVVIYLGVWLISAIWGGIIYSDPLFFKINTLLFLVIAVLRLIHHLVLIRRPSSNSPIMYRCLVGMILCSAAHWGVMSAWVIFGSQNETLHYPYMIITAAFAIGGPSVLSISRAISFYYPLAILLPVLIMGFITGGAENLVLIALAGFSMLYVLSSSRISHNDYWKAITSFKEADERASLMEQASKTDALTQLYNRQHFNERFSNDWKRCCRLRSPISILMIDLDHFKSINDKHGHVAGDECLIKVAAVLNSEVTRATDTVARYGGEEFIIVLPDSEQAIALEFAERIVRAIADIELVWNARHIPISCSIGSATVVPELVADKQSLLIAADDALYQAKQQGRNRHYAAATSL